MTDRPAGYTLFDRWISPGALFLGIACSFLACCAAGRWAGRHNSLHHVERFHVYLAPESLFYPTVDQVRALARSRLDPAKIVVVGGGSSILHGTCQRGPEVWTRKLQALLGDGYQVLNLGFRCAYTAEFGAVAAEVLSRDFPRLIFIADLHPGVFFPEPDGRLFKYFFWDAYFKGLLLPDAARDARIDELAREVAAAPPPPHDPHGVQPACREEVRAEMRLDSALHFTDLWNSLAYSRFVTVWTPLTRSSFARPRRHYPDPDPGAPAPAKGYAPGDNGRWMEMLRAEIAHRCVRDGRNHWVEDDRSGTWAEFDRAARASFPAAARARTLLLVMWYSPHYLDQLSAPERACHDAVSRLSAAHLEGLGFRALEIGPGLSASDYGDCQHLVESGGAKLAAAVAPQVRGLARRLGYLK